MKEQEAEIREELRRLARDLGSIRFRLWGVAASLPETAGEAAAAEPSVRSVIECVVADSITPAIEDLERASQVGPQKRSQGGE